jgi:hypothetical protein
MSRKTTTKYGKVSLNAWASTRQGETEAKKEERLIQEKGRLMITNSNYVYFAKVPGCRLQEQLIYFICQDILGRSRGR